MKLSEEHSPAASQVLVQSPSSSSCASFLLSFRIGILMPWLANDLLSAVLSITPGNFFAEYTWNLSENVHARTGVAPLMTPPAGVGLLISTKLIRSLVMEVRNCKYQLPQRNLPEEALSADTQILQDEPVSNFARIVGKLGGIHSETANQVPRIHRIVVLWRHVRHLRTHCSLRIVHWSTAGWISFHAAIAWHYARPSIDTHSVAWHGRVHWLPLRVHVHAMLFVRQLSVRWLCWRRI